MIKKQHKIESMLIGKFCQILLIIILLFIPSAVFTALMLVEPSKRLKQIIKIDLNPLSPNSVQDQFSPYNYPNTVKR